MTPESVEDDNKLDEIMSTLTHAPFEPVPEEYQQNKTLSEDTAIKEFSENGSEPEAEYQEQYLEKLWGPDMVSYFFHPVFHRSTRASARRRQTTINGDSTEPLILGGYPTGMLQGARIPFKIDLSPWVLEPVNSESLGEPSLSPSRRDSCSRRWSTMSVASSTFSTATPHRPSTVFTLLDVLRLHTGGNPGARRVWEYLRGRSNELLTKKQEELDANGRDTFSAFTREQVLRGNLKPPLCDFVRENPSANLAVTMTKLKAPRMERRFRHIQAMAKWAERNQAQFSTMAYQHDLRDMLTDAELAELMHQYRDDRREQHFVGQWQPISQAQADQLRERLPPLEQRKQLGPLERPRPSIGSLLPPDEILVKKKTESCLTTMNLELDSVQKSREPRTKPKSQVVYLQEFHKHQRGKRSPVKSKENTCTTEIGQIKSPGQLLLQYIEETSPTPLCWSQLIEQYENTSDYLSRNNSYTASLDSIVLHADRRVDHHELSIKPDVKRLWKPTMSIPQ